MRKRLKKKKKKRRNLGLNKKPKTNMIVRNKKEFVLLRRSDWLRSGNTRRRRLSARECLRNWKK